MRVRILVKDPEHKLTKAALMGALLQGVAELLKPGVLKKHRGGWWLEIDQEKTKGKD